MGWTFENPQYSFCRYPHEGLWYTLQVILVHATVQEIIVNSLWPSDTIWRQRSWSTLAQGNGLLPDGTKPLPEPMLTYHQLGRVAFTWVQFYKRCLSHQSLKLAWKLLIYFFSNLPGANELTCMHFVISRAVVIYDTTSEIQLDILSTEISKSRLFIISILLPNRFEI